MISVFRISDLRKVLQIYFDDKFEPAKWCMLCFSTICSAAEILMFKCMDFKTLQSWYDERFQWKRSLVTICWSWFSVGPIVSFELIKLTIYILSVNQIPQKAQKWKKCPELAFSIFLSFNTILMKQNHVKFCEI